MTFWSAPPPPPPPILAAFLLQLQSLFSVALIAAFLLLTITLYAKYKWASWFDAAAAAAFLKTDLDHSGTIDRNELYTCVLELYLQLHIYGLNVKAPKRKSLLKIMNDFDFDRSGTLDFLEFKKVLGVLSQLIFGRAVTQIGMTIACPLAAPFVLDALGACASATSAALGLVSLPVPAALARAAAVLPDAEGLPLMLVSTVLLLMRTPALSWIDERAGAAAALKSLRAGRSPSVRELSATLVSKATPDGRPLSVATRVVYSKKYT